MLRAIVLAIAIGAMTMPFAIDAGALPLAAINSQPTVESNMTLVRDGCGRGSYFSERWGRCVDDGDAYRDGRDDDGGFSKARCKRRCQERRADCNFRRGGYFNGCGVAAATCVAACNM
jgi:hypothetical protein